MARESTARNVFFRARSSPYGARANLLYSWGLAPVMSNDIRVRVGRRIKVLRRERRLSQAQLADAIEMSRRYLSSLERGQASASVETLERIAEGLQAPIGDIFAGEEPKTGRQSNADALGRLVAGLARGAPAKDVTRFERMARAYFREDKPSKPSRFERVARAYFLSRT